MITMMRWWTTYVVAKSEQCRDAVVTNARVWSDHGLVLRLDERLVDGALEL